MTELKYFKKQKQTDETVSSQVFELKVDEIRANRAQPRASFDQNSIIRLADSIRRYGILQPLTVRESDPDDSYRYEIIAGERRLRAARMLGYLTVPCIIKETDEQTSAELAIIENLLREDLNMFEEAYGYRKLIENHGLTQDEVAKRMSISQSAVANKLRLLKLSYEDQKSILESGLTERHARAILRLNDKEKRSKTISYVADNKLNVQSTEEYIEALLCAERTSRSDSAEANSKNDLRKAIAAQGKDINEVVQSIRRKVDRWAESGGNAEINILNKSDSIEISVKLVKSL